MNRRLSLRALIGGALGVLSSRQAGEARSRQAREEKSSDCNPACGQCQTCKKGACKNKNGKKRCKPGRCQSSVQGAACSVPTNGICQSDGSCACGGGKELCKGSCYDLCALRQSRDAASCV